MPLRYDMPVVFGPSLMPDQSRVPKAQVIVVAYETTRDAAAALLPRFYEIAETPIISVSRIDYHGVDYLGNRGYREIVISIAAVYRGAGAPLQAGFAPVMWVSEPAALISGREFMGFGKLMGEMEPILDEEGQRHFECREYGALLLEGDVSGMTPLSAEAFDRVRRNSEAVRTFGWKYIASPDGSPDIDYPTVNLMQWEYQRAWSGDGRLVWHRPDALAAPMSSRVVAALADMPVIQYRRAFVAEGTALINRAGTQRLPVPVETT
jgi:acetoacetate decarboxylase